MFEVGGTGKKVGEGDKERAGFHDYHVYLEKPVGGLLEKQLQGREIETSNIIITKIGASHFVIMFNLLGVNILALNIKPGDCS